MLLGEDSRGKRFRRIPGEDWHSPLHHDWPAIQFRSDEVDGHATQLHAMLNRLPLRVQARKGGQQRGMNVEDRIRERINERCTHESHESGKADQTNLARTELPRQRTIVVISRRPRAMGEANSLDPGRPRSIQTRGIFTVGDDDRDRGIEPAVRDRVDECLKIASASRDENAESAVHCRFA